MTGDVQTLPTRSEYALRLADDALIFAQRLGEWIASAPQIEEDIAVGNIALDLLGQARMLLSYAGDVDGIGRTEDDLAFLRDEREFRNVQLVERPNGDFAETMARLLLFSTYQLALYDRLQLSADPMLAAIAGKAVKEVAYHRDHATQWVLRLGDGTELSHQRMQAGLDVVWPYVDELFEPDQVEAVLAVGGIAVESASLRAEWDAYVDAALAEATLSRPLTTSRATGGRQGVHTDGFADLLTEMQHVHRAHPGASW